jgi:hypothetical protein
MISCNLVAMKAVIVDPLRTLPDERQRRALGHVNGSVVDVPQWLLDERRAWGGGKRDEVWEGVLHMVPLALSEHSRIESELFVVVYGVAKERGLLAMFDVGIFRHEKDYRVPDFVVARHEHGARRALFTAELVVEVRSAHDETDLKIPWYAARGVREIVAISQKSRAVELYVGRDGKAIPVPADDNGGVWLDTVGLRLAPVDTADGHRLHVTGDGIDELV